MNIYSRGAITITHKKPFIDWNNRLFPDFNMYENILGESKTYLVQEIFNDADKLVKKHYKEIFEIELEGICIDENEWPKVRSYKVFCEWFSFTVSDYVIDLCDKPLYGF